MSLRSLPLHHFHLQALMLMLLMKLLPRLTSLAACSYGTNIHDPAYALLDSAVPSIEPASRPNVSGTRLRSTRVPSRRFRTRLRSTCLQGRRQRAAKNEAPKALEPYSKSCWMIEAIMQTKLFHFKCEPHCASLHLYHFRHVTQLRQTICCCQITLSGPSCNPPAGSKSYSSTVS